MMDKIIKNTPKNMPEGTWMEAWKYGLLEASGIVEPSPEALKDTLKTAAKEIYQNPQTIARGAYLRGSTLALSALLLSPNAAECFKSFFEAVHDITNRPPSVTVSPNAVTSGPATTKKESDKSPGK